MVTKQAITVPLISSPGNQSPLVSTLWMMIAIGAFGILIGSLPGYTKYLTIMQPGTEELSPAIGKSIQLASILASITSACLSIALAVILFWRKRTDRMAVFVSFFLLGYGSLLSGPAEAIQAFEPGRWVAFIKAAQSAVFAPLAFLIFCTFPNGRFEPPWTRYAGLASLIYIPLAFFISPNKIIEIKTPLMVTASIGYVAILVIGLYAQIYRYIRVSTLQEQQQTKWFIYGILLFLILTVSSSVQNTILENSPMGAPQSWWKQFDQLVWFIALMNIPLSMSIAILRYRLWDIDVIVRRTLVYSILTAILALVYFGVVTLVQGIFSGITGEKSTAAIVISTLTIAALFNPLRTRIQGFIDHRFYRRKYDAEVTMAAFSSRLREVVDLDDLSSHLVSVVMETIQPAHAAVYLISTASKVQGKSNFEISS